MRSDGGVDFSQHGPELVEVDFLSVVLLEQSSPVDMPLLPVVLQFLINFSDIVIDFLTHAAIFDLSC